MSKSHREGQKKKALSRMIRLLSDEPIESNIEVKQKKSRNGRKRDDERTNT